MALNERQLQFTEEYLVDLNATQAAKRAGYSDKTAYSQGQRLLKNVEIQEEIQAARARQMQRTRITADRVLQEYARIAFFDVRKLADDFGRPLDMTSIDDDTAAAVVGVELATERESNGEDLSYVRKYKMADKLRALDALSKHLGICQGKGDAADDESATGVVMMPEVKEDP